MEAEEEGWKIGKVVVLVVSFIGAFVPNLVFCLSSKKEISKYEPKPRIYLATFKKRFCLLWRCEHYKKMLFFLQKNKYKQ